MRFADRPDGQWLLRDAKRGKFQVVIVSKVDRVGRSIKVIYDFLAELDGYGVGFIAATQPVETTTPFGMAMLGVLAVFAQLERDITIERCYDGRRAREAEAAADLRPGVPHLAIVPPELWDAAHARLRENQTGSRRNAEATYLLGHALIHREGCGLAYTGRDHGPGNGGRVYACGGRAQWKKNKRPEKCGAPILKAERYEAAVWEQIWAFCQNPQQPLIVIVIGRHRLGLGLASGAAEPPPAI